MFSIKITSFDTEIYKLSVASSQRNKMVEFLLICIFLSRCFYFGFSQNDIMRYEEYSLNLNMLDGNMRDLNGTFCKSKWSCKVPYIDDRTCKCDSHCSVYGDCCSDVTETQSKNTFVPTFSCVYLPQINVKSYIFMVQTCPMGTGADLRRSCEKAEGTHIVVSGKNSNYTYRNMYCAACNEEDFVMWQAGYSCSWRHNGDVNMSFSSVVNDNDCSLTQSPPNGIVARECFPVVDNCILSEHSKVCQHGERELLFDHKVYKNIGCVLCNDESPENLTCSALAWELRPKGGKRRPVYSYKYLFDFQTGEATGKYKKYNRDQIVEKLKKVCKDSEMYDVFTDTCRKLKCIPPLVFQNNLCLFKPRNKTDENSLNTDSAVGKLPSCVYILLNDSEYEVINDHILFISVINKTIANDSFYFDGHRTFVCQNVFRTKESHDSLITVYQESESVLSFVGSILSITALTITLYLYIRFPRLQNIPGKSLICLMVSLLVAQLLFLLANKVEDKLHLCTGFAVTIHYTFLASVFWMNCMSFDIFITFSKGFVKSNEDKSSRRFVWYSIYAWITPLIVVVSGICLDLLTSNPYRPRYGHVICWIGNRLALLVYFILPIGLVVLTNIFFYIFTVRSIYRSSHQTNKILRRKKSCKLLVYIKLSVVMGLTWVFAYIASFTNEQVFWYLFIFFNSWQGVFIFIAFVCFGKVRSLVSERAKTWSSYIQSRTSRSTATSSMLANSKT